MVLKTAFLLLVHHQPEHFSRLVGALSADWNDIYVHVDKASDIEPFQASLNWTDSEPGLVDFVSGEMRRDITGTNLAIIEAILSLLSSALESGEVYHRYCLLSGSDYPIKLLSDIHEAFSSDIEFIRVDEELRLDEARSDENDIELIHREDVCNSEDENIVTDFCFYRGSAWWSLTDNCIGHIIDFLQDHPQYFSKFGKLVRPDEVFFHSIIKSSPYSNSIFHDIECATDTDAFKKSRSHGCHYINILTQDETCSRILDASDLDEVKKSKMLFARRVDEEVSPSLLLDIDKYLQSSSQKNSPLQVILSSPYVENVYSADKGKRNVKKETSYINGKQKYIFVISHMRSYSSLLCHILGSNADICGYAESNINYHETNLLSKLHNSTRKLTGELDLSPYVLDKLLHNYWEISDDMISDCRFRFIFLLRQPEKSISSILNMINSFSQCDATDAQRAFAIRHYQSRLNKMIEMAERMDGNALFLPAEHILSRTEKSLSKLTNWLELSQPLNRYYRVFSHTGRPSYGDPSKNIMKGKVEENKTTQKYMIAASDLEECAWLYQQCFSVLSSLNEAYLAKFSDDPR